MASTPSKTPERAAPPVYIQASWLKGAEFARTEYQVVLERDMSIADVVKPKAWAHVSDQLRPRDIIEVVARDMSWCLRLLVRHVASPEVYLGVVAEARFEALPAKEVEA